MYLDSGSLPRVQSVPFALSRMSDLPRRKKSKQKKRKGKLACNALNDCLTDDEK